MNNKLVAQTSRSMSCYPHFQFFVEHLEHIDLDLYTLHT